MTSAKIDEASVAATPLTTASATAGGASIASSAERLEVDEHVPAVAGRRRAGRARRTARRRCGRRRRAARSVSTRAASSVAASPSHGAGSTLGVVSDELDGAVGADQHDGDARRSLDQRGGGGTHGDVDAQQSLAGVDGAQLAFGGDGVRRWLGNPGPRVRRPQSQPTARADEGQHAGGQQRRLADADRRRRPARVGSCRHRRRGHGAPAPRTWTWWSVVGAAPVRAVVTPPGRPAPARAARRPAGRADRPAAPRRRPPRSPPPAPRARADGTSTTGSCSRSPV